MIGEQDARPQTPNPDVKQFTDPYILARESQFLRIFAMDYVTFVFHGDTSIKRGILDGYYRTVLQYVGQDQLDNRLQKYAVAVTEKPIREELGPCWERGKVLAIFCGREGDTYLITIGSMLMDNHTKTLMDIYQDVHVVL